MRNPTPTTAALPSEVFTTAAGLRRMRARLARTRAEYFAVTADNEAAAGSGDSSVWHDNFAYEENQRQMHQLARRVRELETLIDTLQVVPPCIEAPEIVRVGCLVQVLFTADEREVTYYIGGWDDGEPSRGRISYASPFCRALVGAGVGDVRQVGPHEVEVLDLRPAPLQERS